MTRLIDADAFWEDLMGEGEKGLFKADPLEVVLERQPTVDAEPVKHGKWEDDRHGIRCSVCEYLDSTYNSLFDEPYRYCPSCGARMDEVTE